MSDPYGAYLQLFFSRAGIVSWLCMMLGIVVSLCTKPMLLARIEKLIWNGDV